MYITHISWIFSFKTMFRWHVNHDLDLLREVVVGRPKNHTDWASIADKLNSAWGNEENPVRCSAGLALRNNTLRFSNFWMMFSLILRTWNKINQNRRKMTRIEKKLRKWEMQPWKHSREVIQLIQLTNLDCHLRCLK